MSKKQTSLFLVVSVAVREYIVLNETGPLRKKGWGC